MELLALRYGGQQRLSLLLPTRQSPINEDDWNSSSPSGDWSGWLRLWPERRAAPANSVFGGKCAEVWGGPIAECDPGSTQRGLYSLDPLPSGYRPGGPIWHFDGFVSRHLCISTSCATMRAPVRTVSPSVHLYPLSLRHTTNSQGRSRNWRLYVQQIISPVSIYVD